MIIYEYLLMRNKITKEEIIVKECTKTFKIEGVGYFGCSYRKTMSVDELETVINGYDDKLFYYSKKDDIEEAKAAFVKAIEEKIIPNCKIRVENAIKYQTEWEDKLNRLKSTLN